MERVSTPSRPTGIDCHGRGYVECHARASHGPWELSDWLRTPSSCSHALEVPSIFALRHAPRVIAYISTLANPLAATLIAALLSSRYANLRCGRGESCAMEQLIRRVGGNEGDTRYCMPACRQLDFGTRIFKMRTPVTLLTICFLARSSLPVCYVFLL